MHKHNLIVTVTVHRMGISSFPKTSHLIVPISARTASAVGMGMAADVEPTVNSYGVFAQRNP